MIQRALDVLDSEPEIFAWINLMSEPDTLWDIGANVSNYSIYAAIVKKLKVVVFEPEASNLLILSENIKKIIVMV